MPLKQLLVMKMLKLDASVNADKNLLLILMTN